MKHIDVKPSSKIERPFVGTTFQSVCRSTIDRISDFNQIV